ncbi:DMT family transporter [Actinomadura sp. 7K507]|uniref:DMT family transporter n=1 Tax=Actinomadura sp. 7K507 TaxID=2530365 RepID=UPI00104FD403|nr:DMT family transporter [Actinomadura sp. 7K507]TDC77635.1 DMT family transporter [Actinomadura sp. 7K507]
MVFSERAHINAALQALVVCFVWSTSFIVTKYLYGEGIGPVTLTGLRYALASLVLLPLWWWRRHRTSPDSPQRPRLRLWTLIGLGLAGYAINPLGYTIGLTVLPAGWVGVVLGVNNTLQVLLFSALLLRERPTPVQLAAIVVATLGTVFFHLPGGAPADAVLLPTLAVLISGVGYALWVVGNRSLLRGVGPLELTFPSMLVGSLPVLCVGVAVEGLPRLPVSAWAVILGLAAINTSAAFLVWTHTQRALATHESAAINNTMTIQVALLAFLLLGEQLTAWQWALIGVVAAATLTVQTTGKPRPASEALTNG